MSNRLLGELQIAFSALVKYLSTSFSYLNLSSGILSKLTLSAILAMAINMLVNLLASSSFAIFPFIQHNFLK